MADTIDITVVGVGRVQLHGQAPFTAREYGPGAWCIYNADGKNARPIVWQKIKGGGTKPNANTIFARKGDAEAVADAANA